MFSVTKVSILCFVGIFVLGVDAAVRCCRFEVRKSAHTRLCTTKAMLTVNGQFPGPTIYARRGDEVTIDVINSSDENITIHWHGVKLPRYPWSDGTEFVTQCPIAPGKRFTQHMILSDEEGTLWWHAHNGWSRNSVHGAIVILPPKGETYPFPKPHAHVPIILGDWWNADVNQVLEDFLRSGSEPATNDAFLINGQPGDLYPCSAQDIYKLRVEFGKTYLIKVISATMERMMFFKIANHNFTVVGVDGAYTKPLRTDYLAISPGQTIDLLLETNQPPSHYYMAARVYSDGGRFLTIPTTAIIEYVGVGNYIYPPPPSLELPSFPQVDDSNATIHFANQLRGLADNQVPMNVTRNLFYTVSIARWPCPESWCTHDLRQQSSMNNVSMVLPTTMDILQAYYRGIEGVYTTDFPDFPPASQYGFTTHWPPKNESMPEYRTAVSVLEYNTTVELVFQGTGVGKGVEHPMHLHGYNVYFVGSGLGDFNSTTDPPNYNLVDPPLLDTVPVPRNGWAAIRFKANNPGVWYLHCHFERHQSWGMNMAFIVKDGEAPNEKMLPPPPDMPRCS